MVARAVHAHSLGDPALPVADEDVPKAVSVTRHEGDGLRVEGHVAAIGADVLPPLAVAAEALVATAVYAHPLGGPRLAVAHEDVISEVGVVRNKVSGAGVEGHIAAIGANGRAIAIAVPLGAAAVHAHALDGPSLAVAYEDVPLPVGVAGDKVRRTGRESDVAAVGADGRLLASAAPAAATHADTARDTRLAVMDKDVRGVDGVAGHQVGCPGLESNIATVGADAGVKAGGIGLVTVAAHGHPLGGLCLAVAHEDVRDAVGVARHEVGGPGREGHIAAVGADGSPVDPAHVVAFIAGAVHAHPLGDPRLAVVYEDIPHPIGVAGDKVGGL